MRDGAFDRIQEISRNFKQAMSELTDVIVKVAIHQAFV